MTLEEAESICPVIRSGLRLRQRTYVLCQSQAALWLGTLNSYQTLIHGRKEVPDLDRKCKGQRKQKQPVLLMGTS